MCVSSRVNDARSAQQIGALIILPISGLLIAQLTGAVLLTTPVVLAFRGAGAGECRADAGGNRPVRSGIDPDAMEIAW